MNREIKFRAWVECVQSMANAEMIEAMLDGKRIACSKPTTFAYTDPFHVRPFESNSGAILEGNPFKSLDNLMQYTGLKDKHGVEIYEGDIVRLKPNGGVIFGGIGQVMWDRRYTGFKVWFEELEDEQSLGNYRDGHCKVLGNIYENPELLRTNSRESVS